VTDENLVQLMCRDNDSWFREIYKYENAFSAWIRKSFRLNDDDIGELFQAAVITLYDNVRSGKLTKLESSVKTYLFGIGRNKAFTMMKYKEKNQPIDSKDFALSDDEIEQHDLDNKAEDPVDVVATLLKKLGEPCYSLLKMFYWEKLSWENIMETLGYKTAASARNMKYKCLKSIRKEFSLQELKIEW